MSSGEPARIVEISPSRRGFLQMLGGAAAAALLPALREFELAAQSARTDVPASSPTSPLRPACREP